MKDERNAMRVIVIGAGPAGLATAASLGRFGIGATVLDAGQAVGDSWRGHYDRLVLHTARGKSALPGMAMPRDFGRYPTRAQVVDYLGAYARHFRIAPHFGATVSAVRQVATGWEVLHDGGTATGDAVVFATGMNAAPFRAPIPGAEGFVGPILHASDYANPTAFSGQRVLVVGFGNSGGDIALDLADAGVATDIAVRGPVNLLPKELFGIPITSFGIIRKVLPYKVAEALMLPILRLKLGNYARYGLHKAAKGPISQIIEDGRIPLIDVGTLGAIKTGRITVRRGPAGIDGRRVSFADGQAADYDAIVLATGYRVDLRPLLGEMPAVLDDGRPKVSGGRTAANGLYFCSYVASADGQLARIGVEAQAIAADVALLQRGI